MVSAWREVVGKHFWNTLQGLNALTGSLKPTATQVKAGAGGNPGLGEAGLELTLSLSRDELCGLPLASALFL